MFTQIIVLQQELAQVKAQRKELIATLGKLRKRMVDTGKVAEVVKNNGFKDDLGDNLLHLDSIVDELADYFTTLDDGFDRDEFLRRCGV